jgi:hypothetical protein
MILSPVTVTEHEGLYFVLEIDLFITHEVLHLTNLALHDGSLRNWVRARLSSFEANINSLSPLRGTYLQGTTSPYNKREMAFSVKLTTL